MQEVTLKEIQHLLDANKYREAALLLWGPDLFETKILK